MSGRKEKQKFIRLIASTCVTMEMWLRMQVVSWPLQQDSELKIISTRCSVSVRPFSLSHSTTCSSRNCMAGLFTGYRCSASVNLSSTSVCTPQELKGWELAAYLTAKGQIYERKWSPVSPWRLWVCGMTAAAGKGKQDASLTCCRSRAPSTAEPADRPNLPNVESLGSQMLALLQAPAMCVQFFQHCPPGFQCSRCRFLFLNRSSQISSSEDAFYYRSQGVTSPVNKRWNKCFETERCCWLKHSGTHLQQSGHSLQKLQICFLGVDVAHKQYSKLLPEVCQKPLKNIPVAAGIVAM